MAHRTALNTTLAAIGISLLLGITGCNTGDQSSAGDPSTVSASNSGTAMVSWFPPTQRTDGSTLTDLAGYRIYYGKSLNALSRVLDIRNPGQTSQFIDNLDVGTWYFAVTAYSNDGLESGMSDLAAKRIL